MGRTIRHGQAMGKTQSEAERNWLSDLDREYGTGGYQGAGVDLEEITKVKQIRAFIPATRATKVKITKSNSGKGKWINGYKIVCFKSQNDYVNYTPETEITDTLVKAKLIANTMASNFNQEANIYPARLWQDDKGVVHEKVSLFKATPTGGKRETLGIWEFEGEFRY